MPLTNHNGSSLSQWIFYYDVGKKDEPPKYDRDATLARTTNNQHKAMAKDFVWLLLQLLSPSKGATNCQQSVPGWSGFNMLAHNEDIPPVNVVGYCQLIDASTTVNDVCIHY